MPNAQAYTDRVKLSVMLTCYNAELFVDEMLESLDSELKSLDVSYEIIIVDDASSDNTFSKLTDAFERFQSISHIFRMIRNVGQINAITPAAVAASGQYLVSIDSDLQYDPADIKILLSAIESGEFNMVSGIRVVRRDQFYRRVLSRVASFMIRKITGLALVDYGCSLKIFDARVIKAFNFSPTRPFHPLSVILAAGKIGNVPVNHKPRQQGSSGWTLLRLYFYFTDLLVGLLQRPAHTVGICFLILACIFGLLLSFSLFLGDTSMRFGELSLFLLGLFACSLCVGYSQILFSLLLRTYIRTLKHPCYIIHTHLIKEKGADVAYHEN